jgi:hypothetical protein
MFIEFQLSPKFSSFDRSLDPMLREAGPQSSDTAIAARHSSDFRKDIEDIEADFGSMATKLQRTLEQPTLVEEQSSSLIV